MTMNRATNGVNLPESVASSIWADAQEASAVMALSNQIVIPGSGVSVPMITGDAEAAWVNEGAEKPVSDATVDNKVLTPYKLAVIQTFTDEFRRDANALYNVLAQRLPAALARKFDATVFNGTAPGSGFDVLSDAQGIGFDATDTYGDLVAVDAAIAANGGSLNGFALSPQGRSVLLNARDGSNNPLLLSNIQTENGVNSLLGARVVYTTAAYHADAAGDDGEVVGVAGDWTQAFYGTVEGIKVAMSDQATLTGVGNLWQRNMFAIRAEVEIAFGVRNKDVFARLLGANTVA